MIFANVKTLTIPEGEVKKITVGGTLLWQSVVEYGVTQYLTDCSSNNSATIVEEGSTYTATLTASSGYLYRSYVSVRMNGADVTSSVCTFSSDYATVTISIPKITGNIVISAEAVSYENLIAFSTDENGDIYNGVGYGEDEYDGTSYYATGYIPIAKNDYLYFYDMEVYEDDKLVFYDSDYNELASVTVSSSDSGDRFSFDGDEYCEQFYHASPPFVDGGGINSAIWQASSAGVKVRVFCQYITDDSYMTN